MPRYALAPWSMQPNTSLPALFPRLPWASCRSCLFDAYYTIFRNFAVTGDGLKPAAVPASRALRSGKKSIISAFASFAAVLNEKLTSRERTLVMYGRETCMRLASSVWETPSSFMRRSIWRRNAEQMWSTGFKGY